MIGRQHGRRSAGRTGPMGTWLRLLPSVLGAFEVLLAVRAGPGWTVAVGLVGGVALITAPWLPYPPLRVVLLLIGTVPFAALTWWSVAGPLLAVVALAIGAGTLRGRADADRAPVVDDRPAVAGRAAAQQ